MPKHVLLIEDDPIHQKYRKEEFELYDGLYAVTCATSVADAMKVFPEQKWDAIIVDGCLDGDHFDSEPLIRWLREKVGPDCLMIAASSNPDLGELMVKAGCTRGAFNKAHAPGMVHSILRRQ
ncbi:MAG: hypothetical protein WCG07_02815 [Candidatus Taylorbacteria bacterium]